MFANMKLGMKLGLGFAILTALLIVVATLGINRMAALNGAMADAVTDNWPKTVMANDIIQSVNGIAIALRNMVLSSSKDDISANKSRVIEARKVIVGNLEKLEKVITLPKGKELMQKIKETREKYVAGQDQFIKLVEDGKQSEAKD